MSTEQMRKEFEAWYMGPNPVALERNGPHYKYTTANVAWVTWQAALATQPQAPQGAVTPGFQLVPIEPTDEIIQAMEESMFGGSARLGSVQYAGWIQVYKDTLKAAAPKTETPEPARITSILFDCDCIVNGTPVKKGDVFRVPEGAKSVNVTYFETPEGDKQ